jgi:hypothetical protein
MAPTPISPAEPPESPEIMAHTMATTGIMVSGNAVPTNSQRHPDPD